MENSSNKIGWATSFTLRSRSHGTCDWFGCNEPIVKGTGFCKEHGQIKVKVTVTDEKDGKNQERSEQNDGKNKGYHKTYS